MVVAAIAGGVAAVSVVAKYKANAAQKAAAEEQARSIQAAAVSKPAATVSRAKVKSSGTRKAAQVTTAAEQPQSAQPDTPGTPARPIPSTDELESSGASQLPPYLAVSVPPQGIREEKRGKATYMLWDTHRQQLATDDVYVLKRDVSEGKFVKLNGVKAQVAKAP